MDKTSIIIIGAGLAGLSCGAYARMNGYQAQIFEHAAQPGGVSATWQRPGYVIDGGIHLFMGYASGQPVHDLYRELGVAQADQYIPLNIYGRCIEPISGRRLDLTSDLGRVSRQLEAIFPADMGFIKEFFTAVEDFRHQNLALGIEKPPELTTWWDTTKMMLIMNRRLKYFSGRWARPVKEAVRGLKDQWLKEVFQHLFLPDVPMFFLLMLLAALADNNVALRRDGSTGFIRALERRFLDLGGRITYQATVEEILVKDDQAVGVRLENGQVIRADRVVSTGDGYATLYKLLGGRYPSPELERAHEKWPLFKPLVMINYGVMRRFDDEPWMVLFKPSKRASAGFLTDDWISVRVFNYTSGNAPTGSTLIQVMVESDWTPWRELRGDLPAYHREKAQVATQVLECLEQLWPGISSQVEMTDVATPYTMWRYTLNRDGAYEGFLPTAEAFKTPLKRTLPGLSNLYLAGQWVSPGGGVVPSLYTGRHAVMLLCHQDGKNFVTEKMS